MASTIGLIRKKPAIDIATPKINAEITMRVNVDLASSFFFSPKYLDTSAVPPVPNMKPIDPIIMMNG